MPPDTPPAPHPLARSGKNAFRVRALLLGDRIDLRGLSAVERLAADPVTVAAGKDGLAVVLRYGAVVLFDVAPLEETELLRQVRPLVQEPAATPELESLEIRIDPAGGREGLEGNVLTLCGYDLERFQLVADILGKSTVLSVYEGRVMQSFELIEPFAADLAHGSGSRRTGRELLQQFGKALLSEHDMVARAEVADKPEIVWNHPEFERLYLRLEDDFEIRERHLVLERKLNLISRTAETVLGLLQNRRSLRLEWYVVILILIEIVLMVYQLLMTGGGH